MSILDDRELLTKLDIHNLISYLEYSPAWNEVPVKKGWQLFISDKSITGTEIELALPQTQDEYIFPTYAGNAIDVLSQLNSEQPELTIERIHNVNRDVLSVRNIDERSRSSISIRLAAKQVGRLQTLIRQASNSEKDASPYYRSAYHNSLAERMVNEFQFGHTQDKSFGLTVKTPALVKPIEYRQLPMWFPGHATDPVETLAPVSRRIVERIIRGLVATKNAVQQESIDLLTYSYESGFNSNMCKAVVEISRNKEASVEYSVLWSPKIIPPSDIADVEPILLLGTDYAYLEKAAGEMKNLQPDDTYRVRGTIDGLTSPDDPHKFGVGQSIVIKWENDEGRILKVIIDLNPTEYLEAIRAHEQYQPIEVTGELKSIGGKWRLLNPRGFQVVQ